MNRSLTPTFTVRLRRLVRTPASRAAGVLGIVLTVISLSYVGEEFTYDEAVYLSLARNIVDTGLPLRRSFADFSRFDLFQNSPPLVLYVTSVSQLLFPANELPSRIIHIALFAVPTYALVWLVGASRFGGAGAVGGLVALLGSGSYLRSTPHVMLDVPLGLFAVVTLVAFDRACHGPAGRRGWSVVAATTVALALWTKYQAVCICLALAAYCLVRLVAKGRDALREFARPLCGVAAAAVIASALLLVYLVAFGGMETFASSVRRNVGRAQPPSTSVTGVVRQVLETARRTESRVGGVLLLAAGLAIFIHRGRDQLVILLTCYAGVALCFNFVLFRLPGAGARYLDSIVPALALLAGASAAGLAHIVTSRRYRVLGVLVALSIQLAGTQPSVYAKPRANRSRDAARYIAAHAGPTAGVLATTVAIEFYSGNPVQLISYTYPRELVLRSLEGTSGDDVSFVYVDPRDPPKRMETIQQRWDELLERHFEPVPAAAGVVGLHQRKLD